MKVPQGIGTFPLFLYMETNRCGRGLFETELKVNLDWTSRDLEK